MVDQDPNEIPFNERSVQVLIEAERARLTKPYDNYPEDMPLDKEPQYYLSKGRPAPGTPRVIAPEQPACTLGNIFLGAARREPSFEGKLPSQVQVNELITILNGFEESPNAKTVADALRDNFIDTD